LSSGIVIDCFAYRHDAKDCFELIASTARELEVDVILVMDVDKLMAGLQVRGRQGEGVSTG